MNFTATTRKAQGTGASRRLRRENKLPGIVYGNDQAATPIVLDHNPIFYALRKEAFHSSVLTLNLDGVDQLVVLRSFQLHPYKQQVLHIDFQRVDPNKPMNMRVPLHFAGAENSPAVKISKGLISHLVSFLEVHCLPKDLPEFIDVDLSNMTAQTILRASDLNLPAGVTVVEKPGEDTLTLPPPLLLLQLPPRLKALPLRLLPLKARRRPSNLSRLFSEKALSFERAFFFQGRRRRPLWTLPALKRVP